MVRLPRRRRRDYSPVVTGSPLVAQYTDQHATYGGLLLPTRRRVYLRDAAGRADLSLAVITMDVLDLGTEGVPE